MPKRDVEIPGTLKRSPPKARRTYAKTLESAEEQYGEGAAAHRTAYSAVKHSFEKVGDHWEPKDEKGPSDDRAAGSLGTDAPTAGGVDANASKKHLYELATKLEIKGRSSMTKAELVEALQRANNRESARSLRRERN